jgi:manganese/zinc/iron transport system substrate-binding protein
MDPLAWKHAVETIHDELARRDPDNADAYRSNADAYLARIDELHRYAENALASVPERQRVLVTAHDAFNYFARRYGFEVLAVQGLSTESRAGIRRINQLAQTIADREIPAVFIETTIAPRNVRALIDAAKALGHNAELGGQLYSDAMGPPDAYEGTYIGMFDHNVTTITNALGGSAPQRGMNDRLATSTTPTNENQTE